MDKKTVTVIHAETGAVSVVPAKWAANEAIISPKAYTVVREGTKSYVPELYTPRTVEAFEDQHPEKVLNAVDLDEDNQEDEE